MTRRKKKADGQPITKISLAVNGNSVPFTFCGHPDVEHMEATRKATENLENAARRVAERQRKKSAETPQQKSQTKYALRHKSYE